MLTLSQSNHLSNKITMSSENKLQKMSFWMSTFQNLKEMILKE
jgi:hypothetical protein